ncbi:hypothetical protein SAMN05216505_10364 [Streptomyces prasinopilosus]|uniref:Helix-turn-helix domain-containing protein n=1 Tax=Streptomyces prasinopilosus TaxID=67344 RepID=A0A1G6ND11_9ACTN|nr:hypothetical protein SAMN05216505_10364 [Streptomyces prasinopilosus]
MGTQDPNVPPHVQARIAGNQHPNRYHRTGGGLLHDNSRHTARFTVIGNHLAQHGQLSLLAIGLGTHLQSLPKGAPADIKTLTARFPEGATRIAAALRELEAHGYLRRERVRTPAGRIVTRTVSCNQPTAARHPAGTPAPAPALTPVADRPAAPDTHRPERSERPEAHEGRSEREGAGEEGARHGIPRARESRRPLPDVPRPAHPAPALLRAAADLLADLRRHPPPAALRRRHGPLGPRRRRLAGTGRHTRRRTPRPDRRPAARGRPPPRRPPGPPPHGPPAAPAPVPRPGRTRTRPVRAAQLRRLRARFPRPGIRTPLPRLPDRRTGPGHRPGRRPGTASAADGTASGPWRSSRRGGSVRVTRPERSRASR